MGPQDTRPGTTVRYRDGNDGVVLGVGVAAVIVTFGIWWAAFSGDALVTGSARLVPVIGLVAGVLLIPAGLGLVPIVVRRPPLELTPDTLRIVRRLQRVLAMQGPAGPLAVTAQQKHVYAGSPLADVRILAFWSPDGVIGRAVPGSSRPANW